LLTGVWLWVWATGIGSGWAREEGQSLPVAEVEAEGEVLAQPDIAVLILTVETEAAAAEETVRENATKSEAFLAEIKKLLSGEEKVQSLSYRVMPVYRTKERPKGGEKVSREEIAGFRARHTFRVELRDLAKIGKVSDAGIRRGVTGVQGPYWDHSRKEELQQHAAIVALKRARKLAEAMAQAEGLKVKRIIKATTVHGYRPAPMGVGRGLAAPGGEPGTTIEVGEEKFQARVTATFELGQ